MARALWTGSISFGLVNVPVRLYSAISEHKLHFHFVHEKDESPIGYQKICKVEEKPVPEKEIVKAFEYRKRATKRSTSPTSFPTSRSTRSTSPTPTTSARRTAPRRSTHFSSRRWRIRSWRGSPSS